MEPTQHSWGHKEISAYLLGCFLVAREELLLKAAADETRRWNLTFVLDFENSVRREMGFGGTVNYNKKQRRFSFIEYSDRHNWAVRFSIESGCMWQAWDHRDFLFHHVPEYYHPNNKLAKWLLTH